MTTHACTSPNRRWCIPPAILREPNEFLEAAHILEELDDDVGLLLWLSLRDVTLWASVPEERREGLFSPNAANHRLGLLSVVGGEAALEVSLTTLAGLLGNPARASSEIVSLACVQISRWAEARGAANTALAYAQGAALTASEDPAPAHAMGSLALRLRRHARAETWLRRAVGLARRAKDWNSYAASYVDLGTLYTRRGEPAMARRFFVQALRAARRHGLMAVRGTALHGLFLLALEVGELDEAERHARGAMRAFGRGHARLPELVHDVAYLWVSREAYGRAIPMLQKLLPSRVEPPERVVTLAVLARAAAGAGDRRLYEEAWSGAWSLVLRGLEAEPQARALLELARAAAMIRDWPRMEQAAQHALEAAPRRPETRLALHLEQLERLTRQSLPDDR